MEDRSNYDRDFHATLEEVEPGLFRAMYRGVNNPEDAGIQETPDVHLGTDPQEVRVWVEKMALSMGYRRVIWDSDMPGSPASETSAIRSPASSRGSTSSSRAASLCAW